MEDHKKKPLAQLDTDPEGFMQRMATDDRFLLYCKREAKLKEKLGLPIPNREDYPSDEAYWAERRARHALFLKVSGISERKNELYAHYFSGAYNEGRLRRNAAGEWTDLCDIAAELGHWCSEVTIEEVVAEYHRRMGH